MPEPPADLRHALGVAGDAIQPALLLDDAGERQIAAVQRRRVCFEKRIPPQTLS